MLLPLLASFRDCFLFWAESGRIHGIHRLSLFNSFSSFPNHLMLYKAKGRIYCLHLSHSMGWETEKGAQGEREWEASAGEGYAESAPASPFSPLSPASCPLPRHSSRAQVLFCVVFFFFFSNSCCGPSTTDTAYFLNFVFFTSNLEQCLDCHNLKLLDKCQMSDILSWPNTFLCLH